MNPGHLNRQLRAQFGAGMQTYAAVFFNDRRWMGALCAAATLCFPNVGIAGLLSLTTAQIMARGLGLPSSQSRLIGYNSLLVGLSLGASYQLNLPLLGVLALGAGLSVLFSVLLADIFWRWEKLPALSMPFIVAALLASIAAQSFSALVPWHFSAMTSQPDGPFAVLATLPALLPESWQTFFTALGAAFFVPHPLPGLLIALGLARLSRYVLLMAVLGFVTGTQVLHFFTGGPQAELMGWVGFNFILTSVALGAIFTVPGPGSFFLALAGAALSALLTAAIQNILLVYGLPVLALPFLLTTLTMLACLRKRMQNQNPCLILEQPDLPEASYARAQLARHRGLQVQEPLLALPFHGAWEVYQSFNGQPTHQAPWQHAIDFYQLRQQKSFSGSGSVLEDYYCFGLPVLSPVSGYVAAVRNDLPDNPPGTVDHQHQWGNAINWGNYILIHHPAGGVVLLAHLQQHSIKVAPGSYVAVGQFIAACGNSGRSPQPHLHLHVQESLALGSPTRPFLLSPVKTRATDTLRRSNVLKLVHCPEAGETLSAPQPFATLHDLLIPRLGRYFAYRITQNGHISTLKITTRIQFNGEIRLVSDTGASAAAIDTGQVLALYDRQGPSDAAFDLWLLCFGLTPYDADTLEWFDGPPDTLLKQLPGTSHPVWRLLPGSLDSHYQRAFDATSKQWCQQATHRPRRGFGGLKSSLDRHAFNSRAWLCPEYGPVRMDWATHTAPDTPLMVAELVAVGQLGDAGVPQWHLDIAPPDSPATALSPTH